MAAGCDPEDHPDPGRLDAMDWIPAAVPGTAAGALRAAGRWRPGETLDLDAGDWWFRTRFPAEPAAAGEDVVLVLEGIATVSEVFLNGERVLESDSMFVSHELDVGERLREENELAIRCRALAPLLARRRRPRARWRTRLVAEGNLRFYRTMLLGRAPGFAPGPAVVGPWRPVRIERRRLLAVQSLRLRTRLEAGLGTLTVMARLRSLPVSPPVSSVTLELVGCNGEHHAQLALHDQDGGVEARGELVIEDVAPWWPHTHGDPVLHDVRLVAELGQERRVIDGGRVGFRTLNSAGELARDGLQLSVNGVPVFLRGAVWTPADVADPHAEEELLRPLLERVRAAGMNMLRVPGIGCYESGAFHDLLDELGILLWQDFMFANLDYPENDEKFMHAVRREAQEVLGDLAPRPSLTILCGSSEVAQQVAMLGLDPALADGPLYGELLPELVSRAGVDAPYVPSTPWGGALPFRPGMGIANYYGVGAYLRPLEDARRAEVKFAAECLAFSNVPDQPALQRLEAPGGLVAHHPVWKAGVPRDAGAGWDFEDVRDHYLELLFDVQPVALRSVDPERYLQLSRAVTGELMAEVFGEWRRPASPCGGALVLWLRDLTPGAGWGVLDDQGTPKVAYHHLRRALAPVAVWSTDEGLGGIDVHVANDRGQPLEAELRIALYRDQQELVAEHLQTLMLERRSSVTANLETLVGRFMDVSWAYRFGPPAQDGIVLSLEQKGIAERPVAQAFRFPTGRPLRRETADDLGLAAWVRQLDDQTATLTVAARRLVYGVRMHFPGYLADDDAFSIEPGHAREIALARVAGGEGPPRGALTAINLAGRLAVAAEPDR